jgi:putative NADPH-quinone reductase
MRISVILAHPDKNSFNHALVHTVIDELKFNGHTIFYHDLYEENFHRRMFNIVVISTKEERENWITESRELVKNIISILN